MTTSAQLNQQAVRSQLAVRIGIDSGRVVVGLGAGQAIDAFGDAANIAARVQAAAEPGTVAITDATHRLVSGLFIVAAISAQALKGIDRPVQLYTVTRPTGVRGRLQALAARGLTPFVGRAEELSLLRNRWARVLRGDGQALLVIGEAGIGKSRLLQEFRSQIRENPHIWIESGCEQFFESTPFHAIGRMLEQWFIGQGESPEERAGRLERALGAAGLRLNEAVPLIAEFSNLPQPDRYPELLMAPEQKRRRLFATLVEWVFGAARLQPLLFVVEDLHWADPSTLELMKMLFEQGASVPLLVLCSARPEFRAPWPIRAHHVQVALNRLSDRELRQMVAEVPASRGFTATTVESVVKRATGVPLFIEELTRLVIESRGRAGGHESLQH